MIEGPVERIESAYAAHFAERQTAIRDAGAVVREIPGAILYAARGRPHVEWMNVALAGGKPAPELLDRIRVFFREQGLPMRLEALSGELPGFDLQGEMFVLFAMAGAPVPAPPGVIVKRADRSTYPQFADLYVAAFGRPDILRSDLDGWIGLENWRFYTAEIDGMPAGAAMLSLHGDAAYLASAATLPAMRGHGVHQALLRRRMEDAAEAGCSIVFARAAPGGAGASGLMRAGLQLSHRKQIWVEAR